MEFRLLVQFSHEGPHVLADCPSIGVHAFGTSVEDAKKQFQDALILYLETAAQAGQLKRVLKKAEAASTQKNAWAELRKSEFVSQVKIPDRFAPAC